MVSRYTHTKSVAFSVPILRKSQMLSALHADLLYQIPTTTDKKCGKCSQKFIFAFKYSMALIFMKLTINQYILVHIPHTELYQNEMKNEDSRPFTSLSKVCLSII